MLRKGKSAVEGDPKKGWSGIETEAGVEYEEVWAGGWLGGDPLRRTRPHICSD